MENATAGVMTYLALVSFGALTEGTYFEITLANSQLMLGVV